MRLIPISICGLLLSTPCFSADVFAGELSSGSLEKTKMSRLLMEAESKAGSGSEDEDIKITPISQSEINRRLEVKAELLTTEIPKLQDQLTEVVEELRVRIATSKEVNFERATELATLGSYGFVLHKSSSTLLQNVMPLKSSKSGKVILNASLAIMGSGSLKSQIDDFIRILSSSDDTRDISCEMLNESSKKIASVTADIDFNGLSV